ncbi:MAG TPA: hypothetical protein VFW40_03070 [Capsulimonadaceae bacterium]|nr:hypothetical protein [Capsulimonadaceae bacterium]
MRYAGWVVAVILAVVALVLFGLLNSSANQLSAAQQQITSLKSQVTTAQAAAATAQAAAETAKADATSEKEAADKAQKEADYQSLPEIPCVVGFGSPGLLSSEHGSVASIENTDSDEAAFNIHIERPSDGTSKTIDDFVIEGHQARELGEDEGWAFVSGDKLTIREGGHKGETWTMD